MNPVRCIRTLGRARLLLSIVLALGLAPAARAYELVEVRSGSEIVVVENGERLVLELAGVWAPTPPEGQSPGDYRGEDARRYVDEVLRTQTVIVRVVEPRQPGDRTLTVRMRFGAQGEYDLAVSLAAAGLALHERGASSDEQHLEAIYRGERAARQAHVGMHDGGYGEFNNDRERTLLSLGRGVLAPTPSNFAQGYAAYAAPEPGVGAEPPPEGIPQAARDLAAVIGEFWSPLWAPIGPTPDP